MASLLLALFNGWLFSLTKLYREINMAENIVASSYLCNESGGEENG
jgi:hypothetical protein